MKKPIKMKWFENTKTRITLGLALALLFGCTMTWQQMSSRAANCHTFITATSGFSENGDYRYTLGKFTVPSWSTCRDINVSTIWNLDGGKRCAYFRIRVYPFGNDPTGWKRFCNSSTLKVIYAGLPNGTRYRIETRYNYPPFEFRVYD